jgi:hypothetical protein
MFHTKWVPTITPEEMRKQHPDYIDIKKVGDYKHYKKPVCKRFKNAKDYLRYIADYSKVMGSQKLDCYFLISRWRLLCTLYLEVRLIQWYL